MFLGNKEITGIYLGDKEITGVFLGDKEIWSSASPFYVIKSGQLVDGNYQSATLLNQYNHSGSNKGYGWYGCAYSAGNAQAGAQVIFKTNGAKTLKVIGDSYWQDGRTNVLYYVAGYFADGTAKAIMNNNKTYNANVSPAVNYTHDISQYERILINYYATLPKDATAWLGAWLKEVYCE